MSGRYAILVLLIAARAMAATIAFAAESTILKRFDSGVGLNSVGMVDASEDTEIDGPQAVYAGDEGEVYLLDQVNGRVLSFDPKRPTAATRSLELPQDLQPTDLVVRKQALFVWDGEIHALEPRGQQDAAVRGLEEIPTRGIEDEFTVSAFAQMGSQPPGSDTDLLDANSRAVSTQKTRERVRQYVASHGQGPVVADIVPGAQPTFVQIEARLKDHTDVLARLRVEVRDRLGAVEFLDIDRQGRMYVLAENIPPSTAKLASAFVARYSSQGRLESIYDLPLSQSVALSRRFVTISPQGDVYFLRTTKSGVDIVGVGSRSVRNATIIDAPNVAPAFELPPRANGKGPIAAVRPLTRQRVVETAFAFEGVQWRLSNSAYGRDPDTVCGGFAHRIRRPGYLIGKRGQEVRGIPYCWGCHGSLDQIRFRIERGVLAGNVCTHNAPRYDAVGVDCSAFVSAAWGLSTHFTTSAIPAIAHELSNAWDLQPGDALNKPGSHVILFLRFTPDRKAEVMEASPGACNGRVCRNVYPLASLLARGFRPVRFRALAKEPVATNMAPRKYR